MRVAIKRSGIAIRLNAIVISVCYMMLIYFSNDRFFIIPPFVSFILFIMINASESNLSISVRNLAISSLVITV